MLGLYKFFWDCGRNGNLEGVFVATAEEVEDLIGKDVYFGEVLGKHSEIYGTIERGDLDLLTEDQDFIEKAQSYGIDYSGYNPFDYISE